MRYAPISIHAAREGGDGMVYSPIPFGIFQSTPPVKAATYSYCQQTLRKVISIHAAREGGDGDGLGSITFHLISIHAAREGGDGMAGQTDNR